VNFPLIPLEQFQTFLLGLSRVAALIAAMPVFGSLQVPERVKAGLAVCVALLLAPLLSPLTPSHELSVPALVLTLVNEVLLGLLIGLTARLIFTAVEMGGTVIGYQMGFAAANVFDPQTQQQLSLVTQFQNLFAMMAFLALDGHHIFLRLIVESYQRLPPGPPAFGGETSEMLLHFTQHMFVLGIKFSAPILAILLLSNTVLGIMARVFPQLNVFLLSFPINIGVSLIVIALTLDLTLLLLRREFDELGARILGLLSTL